MIGFSTLRSSRRVWASFLVLAGVVSAEMALSEQLARSRIRIRDDPSNSIPSVAPSLESSFAPHGHGTAPPTSDGTAALPTVAPYGTSAPTQAKGSVAPTPTPKDAPTASPTISGTSPTAGPTTIAPTAPSAGTLVPTPAGSGATVPPTTAGSTAAPTPAGTTAKPTFAPTSAGAAGVPTLAPTREATEPTSEPSGPPTTEKKKLTFWRIMAKTIAWLIIIALSVVTFGAGMSNRYRIYYFLRGVWYTILSLDCTMWIMRKLRLGDSASVDPALNTIIFDNEMSEGLLMRDT